MFVYAQQPAPSTATTTPPVSPVQSADMPVKSSDTVDPHRYDKEAIVVRRSDAVYRYAADGTGTRQSTFAVTIQSEAALRNFGVVNVPFAGANEHVEFDYVRVHHADGTTVETPTTDAMELPAEVTRQAPFYSDLKQKQLPVRSLRVGDTLEYQVRVVRTRAESPGKFWGSESFFDGAVVLAESIELHVPLGKEVTVWSPKNKPTITEAGGERIYRWTGSHLEPTVGPEADKKKEADKLRTLTQAEADDLRYGAYPLIGWTTFKSWDAVGTWYRDLETDRVVPDADVKAKVAELLAGKTTDEEKIRALYSYVALNVRYIGVAFGIGRFQPHPASEVLRNQYGDCKDKHTLLAAMLIQAGYKPSAVLIGDNIRFLPDLPSPQAFNHLITQVPLPGGPIWLDSTQEVAPYRAILVELRDKDALVIPAAGASRIEKTPKTLPFTPFERFEATATLSADGVADSHIVLTDRGDAEILLRAIIRQLSPGQYDDFIQRFSQNLGFGGTTSHADISRIEATDEPLRIAYDYKREKPGDWDNLRIVTQLPPNYLSAVDEKDPPKIPIELGLPSVYTATSEIKLPDGWGLDLPVAVHVKTSFANFDKTYRFEHGTLYAERRLEILKSEVPAADWKTYKKFTDDIALNNEPFIQLNRSGVAGAAPDPGNPEAARLVKKAAGEAQSRQFDDALADLEAAKKISETQPFLWSTYAYRSTMMRDLPAAEGYLKKEIKLHPEEMQMYTALEFNQTQQGKKKDAAETLRAQIAVSPNAEASLQLARLLADDEDIAGAISALQAAQASFPDNLSVKMRIGSLKIKKGDTAEGSAALVSVIAGSDNPNILNSAAYELADANMNLDVAETAIRKSLDITDKATQSAPTESDQNAQLANSRMLVADWDTMGWVLFRQHKLDAAEPWIRASWLQGQHAEVGLHLGQIQEARGELNAALSTYTLALEGFAGFGAFSPVSASSTVAKELTRRADALRAKGAKTSIKNAREDLQNLRILDLGKAKGEDGSREFTIVLSSAGIAAEQSADSKPAFKGDEEILHRLDTKSWMPSQSPAKITRQGFLDCTHDKCQFIYIPL
jgi:tetratricopeptide (TPR) repeat protein